MKNFVLSLITFLTIGTTVCFGKTNIKMEIREDSPRHETVQRQHNDKQGVERRRVEKSDGREVRKDNKVKTWRNTTIPSIPVKKNEITISVQSLHF